jgi:hypothetical protein
LDCGRKTEVQEHLQRQGTQPKRIGTAKACEGEMITTNSATIRQTKSMGWWLVNVFLQEKLCERTRPNVAVGIDSLRYLEY